MPEVNLSCKEMSVLAFVCKFKQEKGFTPVIREICGATGITSTSMVQRYLERLEQLGKITRDPGKARSIVILDS